MSQLNQPLIELEMILRRFKREAQEVPEMIEMLLKRLRKRLLRFRLKFKLNNIF